MPSVPDSRNVLQQGGVQASKPVNSAHWVHASRLHNWLVGRPACVIPSHMLNDVEQEITTSFYYRFGKRYADLRYQVRIALQQESGAAGGLPVTLTFPVGGTNYVLDRPAKTEPPREFLFEIDCASQSTDEQEVSFTVLGAEGGDGNTRVWCSVESVPRTSLVDNASDIGTERLDFWPREPITDDDLGDLLDRQDEALIASRRVGVFAMAFGNSAPPSFNSASWTAVLDGAINALGRYLYNGDTTRTLSWRIRARCSDGTTAGSIRINNTSQGTAASTITIPAGTTTATWLPSTGGAAATFSVDVEDNTEIDGLPSSTFDEHTFDVQRTAGAGNIFIESICIWEA